MKVVGRNIKSKITFNASADNLKKAAAFNDSMNKSFGVFLTIPRGVYHYKTHKEASAMWEGYIVKSIVARQTKNKKGGS